MVATVIHDVLNNYFSLQINILYNKDFVLSCSIDVVVTCFLLSKKSHV